MALIAFRGTGAELLLPPTRSLVRAKRALAELPGGGGTPLAAGIEAGWQLASMLQACGKGRAQLVFLTDGRANVDRHGRGGLPAALADAQAMATQMGDRYPALPHGRADLLHRAVRAQA